MDGVKDVSRRFFAVAGKCPVFRGAGWVFKGLGRRGRWREVVRVRQGPSGGDGRGFELCSEAAEVAEVVGDGQ
jgi:hypothetical protein